MRQIKDHTKWMFAEAILEIIKTKDLSKIRITELCDYCNTDRQTFYYHFKDKYDLVAWIYQCDLNDSLEKYNYVFCKEETLFLLCRIKEKQFFYQKAFENTNQNSLFAYIQNANSKITETVFKKQFHTDELTEQQLFTIKYNSYAWVGCLSEWVAFKCTPPPEIYADFLYHNSYLMQEKL